MPKSTDLHKSWIASSARGTQTFNAPANLTIPYGRYVGTVSGRGQTGNNPVPGNASAYSITYNTNYNIAYPIANQPAAAYSITYNTNYNVAYPIANQPAAAYSIVYNTNYNIA